jgi:fibro-slime domain-containing protein
MQPPIGDKMLVPIVYRDFKMHMPADFEAGVPGQQRALTGIVETMLDADGKPVYTGNVPNARTTTATFAEWYRDTPGVNHSTYTKLPLYNNGNGAFVNRWGPNGEQWPVTATAANCGTVGAEMLDAMGNPIPCTVNDGSSTDCTTMDAMGYKQLQCTNDGMTYSAVYQTGLLDGNPTFFPVDGDPFSPASEAHTATIPFPYDPTRRNPVEMGAPLHNFSFTSEVRYWFRFDANKTYTLDFTGDDDVWLFVNKTLAVDLGGVHSAVQGSVTLSAANMSTFGLQDGSVYEAAVFQAERQTTSSTYKLTLSGFSAAPSECRPVCGDGILGLGEECDDGKNLGGYGQCGPDCRLGAYCGDGIVQPDEEDCDDGINDGHPCPSGCRNLIIP